MHYRPERKTVGNLLSMTNPPILVPDWQRNYSWTTSEVDTFWKDLLQFDKRYPDENIAGQEYFLGSVVVVEGARSHLLLDGQQRLATSAILLSVIRDFLFRYNRDSAVRLSNRYLTDYDDAAAKQVFKITLNSYDRDFFKREVLESREGHYESPVPSIESHRLIRKAREFFAAKFEEAFVRINDPVASHKWALRIQRVLTGNVSVVAVFSADEDNAAIVFETLNDRGIGLSTPDLLRNLLLRRAPEIQREEIISLWGQILQIEDDVNIKHFLRHHWISYQGDVKTQSLYREIKDDITTKNIDSLIFSRLLSDASVVYRDILTGNHPSEDVSRLLKDVNDLDATQFYPAILSAFETVEDHNALKRFLIGIIATFVRHTVIGRLDSSLVEDFAFALAKRLRENGDVQVSLQELKAFAPKDDAFKSAFKTASISRAATARYILRELEHKRRLTEELEVSTPSRVHVEHIYPQTPQAGQRWENHGQTINRLGNLTLLSRRLNVGIRNSIFAVKKPSYLQSEILITKELGEIMEWNLASIDTRQTEMSKVATEIWAFPADTNEATAG
jgi:hypothetical protein